MLPVGVPAALLSVAVKPTDCPNVDGLGDDISVVLVAGLVTVSAALVVALLLP
jgi:predicted small secreted protein